VGKCKTHFQGKQKFNLTSFTVNFSETRCLFIGEMENTNREYFRRAGHANQRVRAPFWREETEGGNAIFSPPMRAFAQPINLIFAFSKCAESVYF
jgi:hypothetical protein